jgi:ribonuclease HIII
MAEERKLKSSHVCTVTADQAERFREILERQGWDLDTLPYARWRARRDKTTIVAYESGKMTVQGRGTAEIVQFVLEPEILGEARFGYETEWAEHETPEMFAPHAGIDESGKGDFFGPLVVAAAFVDEAASRRLLELGVTDSKRIRSDRRIHDMAREIRTLLRGRFSVVPIGPEAYNRLYDSIGNVNRLLGWGHARALENLLEQVPSCPRALSDQFGRPETIERALLERGRRVKLEQRTKAESDIAVAAASVLARDVFVQALDRLSESLGLPLPKGAGANVDSAARDLVAKHGSDVLRRSAKLHFKTTQKVLDSRLDP